MFKKFLLGKTCKAIGICLIAGAAVITGEMTIEESVISGIYKIIGE